MMSDNDKKIIDTSDNTLGLSESQLNSMYPSMRQSDEIGPSFIRALDNSLSDAQREQPARDAYKRTIWDLPQPEPEISEEERRARLQYPLSYPGGRDPNNTAEQQIGGTNNPVTKDEVDDNVELDTSLLPPADDFDPSDVIDHYEVEESDLDQPALRELQELPYFSGSDKAQLLALAIECAAADDEHKRAWRRETEKSLTPAEVKMARRAFDKLAPKGSELRRFVNASQMGSHPAFAKGMVELARAARKR